MIHTLICDDDKVFALRLKASLEALLEEKRIAGKVSVFGAAEEIGGETLASCDTCSFVGLLYRYATNAHRSDNAVYFTTLSGTWP